MDNDPRSNSSKKTNNGEGNVEGQSSTEQTQLEPEAQIQPNPEVQTEPKSESKTQPGPAVQIQTDSAAKTTFKSEHSQEIGNIANLETVKNDMSDVEEEFGHKSETSWECSNIANLETIKNDMSDWETMQGKTPSPMLNMIPKLTRYEIINKLGHGGMGIVYKARDKKLSRTVALKFLLSMRREKTDVERFQREAKAMALLKHPNIISIYDIGEEYGYPFFTMDLVEGISFKEFLDDPRRDLKKATQIMVQVGRAVHYAHTQGIIHRDLKPANIMVTKENIPIVMDFGLAKISNSPQDDLSQREGTMGTPSYMSPEQVNGVNIDTRTDIYALGATLYEILTRRPPFQGETYMNVLTQLLVREPVLPSKINPDIPPELEAICLKSLEKTPSKRYDSAELWAQDLENFLTHRPVMAKIPTIWTHVYKFVLRNKFMVLSIAAIFLSILIGGSFSFWEWRMAESERRKAEQWSEKNAAEARHHLITLIKIAIEKAKELANHKEWSMCGTLAGNALELLQPLELKGEECLLLEKARNQIVFAHLEHGVVWRAKQSNTMEKSLSSRYGMATVAFSPDGKLLASNSTDSTVQIWDASTGKLHFELREHTSPIQMVAFSPDGKFVASAGGIPMVNGELTLWDMATKKVVSSFVMKNECIRSLSFNPVDNAIALGLDHRVGLWNYKTQKITREFINRNMGFFQIAFSPDGKLLAAGSSDKNVYIWDASTGEITQTLCGHTDRVYSVSFSRNGARLASSSNDRTIRIWNPFTGKFIRDLQGHHHYILSVAFSPNSKLLASASYGSIGLWNVENGQLVQMYNLKGDASSVAFNPDGKTFVSASSDRMIRAWDLRMAVPMAEVAGGEKYPANILVFSPNGKYIASACYDYIVYLWDIENQTVVKNFAGHEKIVRDIAFSPDGNILASCSDDTKVCLWNVATGKMLQILHDQEKDVLSLAFSPDGKMLASTSEKTVVVWDISTLKTLHKFKDSDVSFFDCVAFHPDGTLIVAGKGCFLLLNPSTGSVVHKVSTENKSMIETVAVSPDGKWIATGFANGMLSLWDARTQKIVHDISAHKERLTSLYFSYDGRLLLSGAWDKTAKIWDVATGELFKEFIECPSFVNSVAFSPDGKKIAIGNWKQNIQLWDFSRRAEAETFFLSLGNEPKKKVEDWFEWYATETFALEGSLQPR